MRKAAISNLWSTRAITIKVRQQLNWARQHLSSRTEVSTNAISLKWERWEASLKRLSQVLTKSKLVSLRPSILLSRFYYDDKEDSLVKCSYFEKFKEKPEPKIVVNSKGKVAAEIPLCQLKFLFEQCEG